MSELPTVIRQHDVAKLLGVNKKVVQRHAKRGMLTPIRDGRAVYFTREEVLGLFELCPDVQRHEANFSLARVSI